MAAFSKGDAFEEVEQIQSALGIAADGKFGPATVAAVKAWQQANDADATGEVGPDMLLALGLDELVILEKGDSGDLVLRVQSALGLSGRRACPLEPAVRRPRGIRPNSLSRAPRPARSA